MTPRDLRTSIGANYVSYEATLCRHLAAQGVA